MVVEAVVLEQDLLDARPVALGEFLGALIGNVVAI